jgi:hypothetical protein
VGEKSILSKIGLGWEDKGEVSEKEKWREWGLRIITVFQI